MGVIAIPEERAVVEATVDFANLRSIRSTAQVEALFRRLPQVPGFFKVLRPHEAAAYKADQERLRRWLGAIAASREAARIGIGAAVRAKLRTVSTALTLDEAGSGSESCTSWTAWRRPTVWASRSYSTTCAG